MVDYDKIGKRMIEQRKHILHVSQERMAEDLGMYQADISNLEKAKRGSGITDLDKLDLIADYFSIPLETLIFGMEDKNMMKYSGSSMELKAVKKKIRKPHMETLKKLTGRDEEFEPEYTYECGPYTIYGICEMQFVFGKDTTIDEHGMPENPQSAIVRLHLYVFYGAEIIANAVAAVTDIMHHVFQPALVDLQQLIPMDILDVTDVIRTLNPYWALHRFSSEEESKNYEDALFMRMNKLREYAEMKVLYVESLYVREDCRRKGICRMLLDALRLVCGKSVMWVNMEPTSGQELENENESLPQYTVSDLGQLNINAAIAEHLGLTVDPDTWHRTTEKLDENGNVTTEVVEVRKCSYFLPAEIREITKDDKGLVADGRAKQRIMQQNDGEDITTDMRCLKVDGHIAYELRVLRSQNGVKYYTAVACDDGSIRYVVSLGSLDSAEPRIEAEYTENGIDQIDDECSATFCMAGVMLQEKVSQQTEIISPEDYGMPKGAEAFEVINVFESVPDDDRSGKLWEARMINRSKMPQELRCGIIFFYSDGRERYVLSRTSYQKAGERGLEPEVVYNSYEDMLHGPYATLFLNIKAHFPEMAEAFKI